MLGLSHRSVSRPRDAPRDLLGIRRLHLEVPPENGRETSGSTTADSQHDVNGVYTTRLGVTGADAAEEIQLYVSGKTMRSLQISCKCKFKIGIPEPSRIPKDT